MWTKIKQFWKDTKAAVAFEAVIITPILAWTITGSFVFFDAYRVYNTSLKATYAVADILSRQTSTVYGWDIIGLGEVFEHMVPNGHRTQTRVTQVLFNTQRQHVVDWSFATNGQVRLFTSTLPEIQDQIPVMGLGDRLLIVETFIPYEPAFNMGLLTLNFSNFTTTRPRYAGQVPFDDSTVPPIS